MSSPNKKYYVYKIYNKVVDKYYVGSRTISSTIDILNGYNTSSKIVHNLIEQYGIESFNIVSVQEYNSMEDAVKAEDSFLKSIKKVDRCKYLNINFNAGGAVIISQSHVRIYNPQTDEYMYSPKNLPIPDGWIKRTRSIPPSRSGLRKYINLDTKQIAMLRESNSDRVILYTEYKAQKKKPKKLTWITDGTINTKIGPDDPIPDGWRLGKTADRSKTMRITNGNKTTTIRPNDPIPDGWWKGDHYVHKPTTKGKIRITNGITTTTIDPNDPIPDGWKRGTVSSSKTIYKIDNQIFYIKKDLLEYLGETQTVFDRRVQRKEYKGLTIIRRGVEIYNVN